jgi:Flp pilus assembly protein TadG
MLFGMIQFGLVFAGWSSLRNSVETSARMLAIGDLPASASVNCTPPNGLNAITSAAYCTVIQEIGTPIGTTGGSSQVGFLVTPGSGTTPTGYVLTVCGQVQAQNLTGVLNLNPSSSSSFLIEDSAMTGPSGIQDYNSSLPGCG